MHKLPHKITLSLLRIPSLFLAQTQKAEITNLVTSIGKFKVTVAKIPLSTRVGLPTNSFLMPLNAGI